MRTKETAGLLVCALLAASALAPARAAALGAGVPTAGSVSAPSVARLSVIADGTVSITHGADATKVDATVNAPLLAGDGFATTGADVRAEIQLDGLTILRLGPGVRGRIASNDVRTRVIEIDAGLVELALLRGSDTATEIVTPALTVRTRYAGNYRVNVTADGSTTVAARSGQTDAITPSKTYTLVAGQTLEAPAGAAVAIRSSVARDPFDEFNDARDRTLLAALDGDSHLPASIAGYDDLNAYGQWTDVASYGEAWVPKQDANWAPYRDGQWTDTSGYGMTWVGSEPWGWVPYHYGRWFFVRRFGWCWYPPRFTTLPIWAPGLVGFFGSGYGPFGYSTLGWVPLAPFETYYPWYPWQWYAFRGQAVRSHPAPPKRMQPLATAFRNARFGGASVLGAAAWHAGNFAHPAAVDSTRLSTVTLVRGHLPMLPDRPLAPASTRSALTEMSAQPSWQSEFQHAASILTLPGLPALPAQSVPIRAT
ncbi:MAG TPA: DUF6600 domain-containing protein, partial [Candidatus Tumulicola sp.]